MSTPLRWADHRVFAPVENGRRAILFGAEDASLFTLEPEAHAILARWRTCEVVTLERAPDAERDVLGALRDARMLRPANLPVPPGCDDS